MKRWSTLAGIAITGLALACGGGEDRTATQVPAASTTPDAPAADAPPAQPPARAAETEAPPAAAVAEDAVKSCLALAAQQMWSDALDPCTQALKENPDDLRIKHAVQQAQAAAGS